MNVKATRNKDKVTFILTGDDEFIRQLSKRAQQTCTSMLKIIERAVIDTVNDTPDDESKAPFDVMSSEFARRWIRFPHVIRHNMVQLISEMGNSANMNHLASMITGAYKRNKKNWDEQLSDYGEYIYDAPYTYFMDNLSSMFHLLLKYNAIIGDQRRFSFASEGRLEEFIDNDVNFGEWQDDCYGLRTESALKPVETEIVEHDDEEDTFD